MESPKHLKLGSLFDGIGGFPHAGSFLGIKPIWASEILPQAVSVTMRHFPDMEHMGDLTQLNGADLPPVDILTFGSPCQDLSTAGRRAGINGERSSLFYEAIRIIDEMRCATNGKYPKYAVWENVPGALSSGKPRGSDFRAVLEAFTKTEVPMPASGGWANAGLLIGANSGERSGEQPGLERSNNINIAWRILNAQYHGVPQRRRRIFLVASFGAGCPGEILFVEKGLRGDTAPGCETRQGVTADAKGCAGGAMCGESCGIIADDGKCTFGSDINCITKYAVGNIINNGVDGNVCTIAFAANQRDEVRDLGLASGALQAQPGMKQQTFVAQKPPVCNSVIEKPDCLTPWDVQSRRIHSEDGQWPTLYGESGGGHGYAAVAKGSTQKLLQNPTQGLPQHPLCAKCLNPWETQQSRVFTENGISPTLAGADGGGGRNPAGLVIQDSSNNENNNRNSNRDNIGINPVAAFLKEPSANARSIGYSEEVSPTLKSTSPCLCEKRIECNDVKPKGAVDKVDYTTGNHADASKEATVYSLCAKNSNSMLSANPKSGIYKADTSRTLDQNGGNPTCNQGGMIILESSSLISQHESKDFAHDFHQGQGNELLSSKESQHNKELQPTIILNDQGGESMSIEKSDISPTLRSETHGHLPIVAKKDSDCAKDEGYAYGVHQGQGGDVNVSETAYSLTTNSGASSRNAPLVTHKRPIDESAAKVKPGEEELETNPNVDTNEHNPILGAAGLTSKGNGDCFLSLECHGALSQGGGQAGQGYPCVLIPCGLEQHPSIEFSCNDPASNIPASSNPTTSIQNPNVHPNVTGTLVASGAGLPRPGGMASEPDLCVAYEQPVYALQGNMIGRQDHNGPQGNGVNEDVCFTVTATDVSGIAAVYSKLRSDHIKEVDIACTQTARQHKEAMELVCEIKSPDNNISDAEAVYAVDCRNYSETGDLSGTLSAKNGQGYSLNYQNPVRVPINTAEETNPSADESPSDTCFATSSYGGFKEGIGTLRAQGGSNGGGSESMIVSDKSPKYIVRRLTPTECERLQGFPDGWTKYGHDGKEISDTRRYQMLGNSVAIPCVIFVLGGIVSVENATKCTNCAASAEPAICAICAICVW